MELYLPKDLLEFEEAYASEEQCWNLLMQAKWPQGYHCAKCGCQRYHPIARKRMIQCADCKAQTSPLANTLFHGTKLPLKKVFRLMYLVVGEKDGMNHCALSRQLSIRRKCAQLWVRKIRNVMSQRQTSRLEGTVEVDEIILGGPAQGKTGRALGENQALILIMVENQDGRCGRTRLEAIEHASSDTLKQAMVQHIEAGSTVKTDGWRAYPQATAGQFIHQPKVQKSPKDASKELPLVHRVGSLFKRFVLGTFHGAWSMAWLPWLLEEFEFRFNRRNTQHRPGLFNTVIQLGTRLRPPTRQQFSQLFHLLDAKMPLGVT